MRHMYHFYEASENNLRSRIGHGFPLCLRGFKGRALRERVLFSKVNTVAQSLKLFRFREVA